MSKVTEEPIKKIQEELEMLRDKSFTVFFFVYDSKGTPSGSLANIYETALALKGFGYKVQMLHADKDFVGVRSWLGDEAADLPHMFIDKDTNLLTHPSDFLIIPEIYTSVMSATKSLNCKRIVLWQNSKYIYDTIPMGVDLTDMNILDVITTSDVLAARVKDQMPGVVTEVCRPLVSDVFKPADGARELVINVLTKTPSEANEILKPFYSRYPQLNWVAFRNIKDLPREEFAKAINKSVATIWSDRDTEFGHIALEAMACGNVVIGRVPDVMPEWMRGENGEGIADNGLWFYDPLDAKDLIDLVVSNFISDGIPKEIYENMEKTVAYYRDENFKADVQRVYGGYVEKRIKELELAEKVYKSKMEEAE